MKNMTLENAKAKVMRLEALEADFAKVCDNILDVIISLAAQKQSEIETAPKSDKAVLKEQLKKLQRAIKLFDGGKE